MGVTIVNERGDIKVRYNLVKYDDSLDLEEDVVFEFPFHLEREFPNIRNNCAMYPRERGDGMTK